MTRIEPDFQTEKRFLQFRWRQYFRRSPKPRHGFPPVIFLHKSQREKFPRIAVHQYPRGFLIYFDQVGSESVSAINIVDQVCELVVRNCFLIILEDTPSRFAAENADVVGGMNNQRKEQQKK